MAPLPTLRRRTLSATVVLTMGVIGLTPIMAQTRQPPRELVHRLLPEQTPEQCCPVVHRAGRQGLQQQSMPDGEPLSFLQHPAILRADQNERLRLEGFAVIGDHETVEFQRADTFAPDQTVSETWERVATATLGGREVSLFEPSWPVATLRRRLRQVRYGFDRPHLYWGQVVRAGSEASTSPDGTVTPPPKRSVYLRIASTGMPRSTVRRMAPDVQYASHVVNLVIPGFDDSRPRGGEYDYDLRLAAQRFFAHVTDSYDSIAFIPERSQLASTNAFHRDVRNTVTGIGTGPVDQSHAYGSGGRLKGVEVYHTFFGTNDMSSHELAHQWGDELDWATLAGIERAGHQPTSHTPLLYPRETIIGAVLDADVRVGRTEDGYQIERTPGPMRFHPLQRYRMGLLPAEQVPDVLVFVDQAQFLDAGLSPPLGTPVTGETRRVTIEQIIAHHGPRTGPAPRVWRRATVVVSSESLLSHAEMSYWNYWSRRLEDASRTGVVGYLGHPSFDVLTARQMDLRTAITPRDTEPIVHPLNVDYSRFGTRDWPGVTLDEGLPGRLRIDSRTMISGRVATGAFPGRVDWVLVSFSRRDGEGEDLDYWDEVDAEGRFSVEAQPRPGEAGVYRAAVYVFWTDAPPQWPRATLSPVVID